jgi:Amt family ammonium transporter
MVGSQLAMGSIGDVADVSRIFSNTNAAAAGGAIAALILTQLLYKKPDLTMILKWSTCRSRIDYC